ncbi:carboxypeptidase M32 [Lacibacterium aquatile]|uniref:Metal-dependent carboxypeptidase n=1 Tax=Lacibacterium aquatile TaxID=1168082 RepID=A0ABW5DM81_9PROT
MTDLSNRIGAVNDVLNAVSLLTWDSRTMMPGGGAETRGQQIATLTRLARDILLSEETRTALKAAEAAAQPGYTAEGQQVIQTREAIEHHSRVPADLIEARAGLRTVAQSAWIEARSKSDFSIFAPHLEKTVELSRRYADAIGWEKHPYDALISLYEPGETVEGLQSLFATLKAGLKPILAAVQARPQPRTDFLTRDYPEEGQRAFGLKMAQKFGYDLTRGRLDTTVHPFEVSFTRNDVRITTRYRRDFLPASIFGTFHEAGHGMYEQNVDPAYTRTTLATDLIGLYAVGGTSFGAHESQSRLWENHVGRNRAFWRLNFAELQAQFPDKLADVTADEFYAAVTRIQPGFIRVEADELTYDFHIMLRVEIERRLIEGSLAVKDLPEVWNAAIKSDLGLTVPDDARGVLQDVHWSTGYFGSFPTYTVGNVMAAQLMDTLRREQPDIDIALADGDYASLAGWLRGKVWQHGRRFTRDDLLIRATGRALDPKPYLAYLTGKYA